MKFSLRLDRGYAATAVVGVGISALISASPALAQIVYEGVDNLPEISLRMTEFSSMTADAAKGTMALVDYIQTNSKGKIKIEVFWSSALMTPMEAADGIASGIADLGAPFAHFRPSDFPVSNWVQIIGVMAEGGNPFGSMVATGAATEFFATSKDVQNEFHSRGLHLLSGSGSNAYDILCTSPIATLADAAGKRTRTGTTTLAKEAAALGMVATPLDINEAFEALSRGIIDCGNMTPTTYVSTGMVDVPRQLYWTPVEVTGLVLPGLAFNLDKWNSLPPVAQQIVQDAIGAQQKALMEGTMLTMRKFGDLIKKGTVIAVKPADELQAAATKFEDEVLAGMLTSVPAGVEDPAAVIERLKGLMVKWQGIINDLGIPHAPKDVEGIVAGWYTDYDWAAFGTRFAEEVTKAKAAM